MSERELRRKEQNAGRYRRVAEEKDVLMRQGRHREEGEVVAEGLRVVGLERHPIIRQARSGELTWDAAGREP